MPDLHALARQVRRALARFRRPLSALLAGVAVLAVIETLAPAAPPSRDVAVAAHDISGGAVVSAADVRVVAMPPSVVPTGASSSTAAVVGQVLAGPVRAGEAFTDRRVLGRSLLAGYPRGLVAAPIHIRDAGSRRTAGRGDRIDVYAARRDTTVADLIVAGVR